MRFKTQKENERQERLLLSGEFDFCANDISKNEGRKGQNDSWRKNFCWRETVDVTGELEPEW